MFCLECGEAMLLGDACTHCDCCEECCSCTEFHGAGFDDDELGEDPEYDWETGPGRR